MSKKSIIFIIIFLIIFFLLEINKKFSDKETVESINLSENENLYSSNIIKDVNYISSDRKGNEYIINSEIGEIDINNPDIIYLTNVEATIRLKNSEKINITSNYGKYNSKNFDTIFSKNVIIKYLNNNITGEYLDFSLERNFMVVSRNVVYKSDDNILKADVLEMNVKTKDSKIFMYEKNQKVNIQSVE